MRGYLHALRLRWWLVAGLAVLGAVLGLAAYLLTPAVYASTVTFYVSVPPTGGGSSATSTQYAQAKVSSYVSLVRSEEVARRVVADQKLTASPSSVASTITASAQLNTTLLTVTVQTGSPERSATIARGVADTFGPLVDELDNAGRPAQVIGVDVVSGPTVASSPVSPDLKKFFALGLLAGLVLGALLAVLRDLLDVTVRSSTTAAEVVGAPTLAVVDEDRDDRGRAESVRQLRTNLAFLRAAGAPTSGAEVVVVTSALGGEGKTTTALDLARSFAETGERVLLVEADLRRPTLAPTLHLEPGPGLSDVLAGQAEVAAAVRPGGAEGLSVLPAGTVPPNPAELLGSARMADTMGGLRSTYDKVLLDAAPLLPVTDAAVCSAVADGVLLVVRWGRTSRSEVAEAVVMLEQVHATVLGSVLNGRRLTRSERRRYSSDPSAFSWSPTTPEHAG
nr:polysaccharide biosynthesis tyrosine autokinase [Microlunatus antarcticus]